jgi:hypothetical protein
MIEKEKLRAQYQRAIEQGKVKPKAQRSEPTSTPVQQVIVNAQTPVTWLPKPAIWVVMASTTISGLIAFGLLIRGVSMGTALIIGLGVWATLIVSLLWNMIAYQLYWLLSAIWWIFVLVGLAMVALSLIFDMGLVDWARWI